VIVARSGAGKQRTIFRSADAIVGSDAINGPFLAADVQNGRLGYSVVVIEHGVRHSLGLTTSFVTRFGWQHAA
jgi:hypothetical protein